MDNFNVDTYSECSLGEEHEDNFHKVIQAAVSTYINAIFKQMQNDSWDTGNPYVENDPDFDHGPEDCGAFTVNLWDGDFGHFSTFVTLDSMLSKAVDSYPDTENLKERYDVLFAHIEDIKQEIYAKLESV